MGRFLQRKLFLHPYCVLCYKCNHELCRYVLIMASDSTLKICITEEQASALKKAIGICVTVDEFADELVAIDFISSEQRNYVLDPNCLRRESARRLVEAVRIQVELDPGKFEVFITMLERHPALIDLAAYLKRGSGEMRSGVSHIIIMHCSFPGIQQSRKVQATRVEEVIRLKDAELREKEEKVRQKDEEIEQQKLVITEKDKQIQRLHNRLTELQVYRIIMSTS